MPGLRTRSAGAKVTEEEYAALEELAEARGQNVSELCREAMLRELRATPASRAEIGDAAAHDPALSDPALAEIVGVRLLLVNVLGPMAAGETMTQERFNQLLDQISETKHQLADKLQEQAHEKSRPEKPSGGKR